MEFSRTAIPNLMILQPKVFGDERGFFMETFREDEKPQDTIHVILNCLFVVTTACP